MTETQSCIKCGHDQGGGNFCEVCGERFPEPLPAEPPASSAIPKPAPGAAVPTSAATTAAYAAPTSTSVPAPAPEQTSAVTPAPAPTPPRAAAPPMPPVQPHSPYAEPQYTTPQYAAPRYEESQYQVPPAGGPAGPPNYTVPPAVPPRAPRDDVWTGLFDFSFRRFPTPGLVRLAWIVGVIWVALSLIVAIWVISDNWGGGLSVFILLKSIAVAVFALAVIRLALEAALAIFRIREKKE